MRNFSAPFRPRRVVRHAQTGRAEEEFSRQGACAPRQPAQLYRGYTMT